MFLTFGKARRIVAQYAGKGGLSYHTQEVHDFLVEVMQYMLHAGQYGNTRKFCFHAVKGCLTLPYELEVPLEVKIDGAVGRVWNRWFEFNDSNPLSDCVPASIALVEDPNYYPTVYDVDCSHANVGVLATCEEDEGAHVLIQGKDLSGREIFTQHKGGEIKGEYLSIKRGRMNYTHTKFATITGVTKTETKGYVQMYAINPDTNARTFLSEYTPMDTVPSYRRYKLTHPCPDICKVTVLGRIRVRDAYADNDKIFFDNILNIRTAAQTVHNMANSKLDAAAGYDTALQTNIERENSYRKPATNNPIRMNPVTAGSTIRNITSRRRRR